MIIEVELFGETKERLNYGAIIGHRKGFPGALPVPLAEWLGARKKKDASPIWDLRRQATQITLWEGPNRTVRELSIEQLQEEHYRQLSLEIFSDPWSYPRLSRVRHALRTIRVYTQFLITPLWARDAREGSLSAFDGVVVAPAPRIEPRGLNLINSLFHLQNDHHETWEELVDAFRAEFPFVQRLEFPADPAGGRIALGWRDRRYPGVRMQGHQMSEGMTAYLCLLAAILSPEPATAIAFDEPDVHLHPSAMRRLVYLLEKASERTAVFVTTHSDRLLDFLSDPAGSLRVCEPKDGGVTIQSLNGDALDEWRKRYSLSELRQRGHLDSSNASAAEL
jgi:predicted ATPase